MHQRTFGIGTRFAGRRLSERTAPAQPTHVDNGNQRLPGTDIGAAFEYGLDASAATCSHPAAGRRWTALRRRQLTPVLAGRDPRFHSIGHICRGRTAERAQMRSPEKSFQKSRPSRAAARCAARPVEGLLYLIVLRPTTTAQQGMDF